jgi:UDPglucose 6-dehydrogenase
MHVSVFGLWHLGCVTAACLAKAGHEVLAIDPDEAIVAQLRDGKPPLSEPGLKELMVAACEAGKLRFESDLALIADNDVVWVTYDTPVDDNDVPRASAVTDGVMRLFPHLSDGTLVILSSQVSVGTTRSLAKAAAAGAPANVSFAYSPENLQLGRAIEAFMHPDRVVVGLERDGDRGKVSALLAPLTDNIVWMGIEAAEMTKHAINAFLATSVSFMNEIATLCEQVGADAREVERGLKSERRIGPKAYLSPGGAFAGGTLARDIAYLESLGRMHGMPLTLFAAVRGSNQRHASWPLRMLQERVGTLAGRRIAILGLTYKPGTDTLRRSSSVELALALHAHGAAAVAFDPAVSRLPRELALRIELVQSAAEALKGVDAAVLATPWPAFAVLDWKALLASMASPTVIDPGWFLADHLKGQPGIDYAAVGLPRSNR